MTIIKNIPFSSRYLLLAVALVLIGGCATSGSQLQAGNQNVDFSSVRRPVQSATHSYKSPEEISRSAELPQMSSDELERVGDSYFANGNLQMAYVNYEKSIQANQKNLRVVCKKGLLLLCAGLNQDAEKVFAQVLKDEPNHALAHEGLGRAYFQMKKYDDAKVALQNAVKLNPSLWAAYNLLGVIHDIQEHYGMALGEYRKALSLRPNEGMLYHNLGVSLSLAGKYEEAVEAFRVAIMKGYREKRVYNSLGLSLSRLGRYREAYEAFKTGGSVPSAYNNLGFVYLNEGKHEEAVACFEKAIANSPEFYARASENLKTARASSQRVP
jgi:Flp pilus assembly protein TadD